MKVAINVLAQSPGHATGSLSQFLQMGRYLPERDPGSEYIAIAGYDDVAYYKSKLPKARVVAGGWGNRHRLLRVLSEHLLLGPVAARENVDILFHAAAGVGPAILPRKVRLVLGIWALHHIAAGQIPFINKLYRTIMFDRSLRRASCILVNSEYTRALLFKHRPNLSVPVEVIHHGIDSSLFNTDAFTAENTQRLAQITGGGPYVLYVGQVYPYKRLDVLVEAFCKAAKGSALPHKLVIVGSFAAEHGGGENFKDKMLRLLADAGLADRLVLGEDISVRDLRLLYAGTELYVQPSSAETFGRTVIEAMACGAPVLAAHAASTPEILGDAGVYYPTENVDECAARISEILGDEAQRTALRAKGLERVKLFSFDNEIDKVAALFHRVAAA